MWRRRKIRKETAGRLTVVVVDVLDLTIIGKPLCLFFQRHFMEKLNPRRSSY